MGPIGVASHLVLCPATMWFGGEDTGIDAISAAPFSSALIAQIPYAYIKMLGQSGMTSTKVAILNANYLKAHLEGATTCCTRPKTARSRTK